MADSTSSAGPFIEDTGKGNAGCAIELQSLSHGYHGAWPDVQSKRLFCMMMIRARLQRHDRDQLQKNTVPWMPYPAFAEWRPANDLTASQEEMEQVAKDHRREVIDP